ncbi:MAG: ELM1/GtrOC1 family putative glycosyltransferase [Candidatus Omnitrophica bacterium]|nr:ELM1/GtrOC1 family putative glycosyltransferase [Candidatus Omnitrophota bacterium]
MKKDFIADYASCIAFRLLSPVVRVLPLGFSLFLGRLAGELLYVLDCKHRARAYANIKTALGKSLSPAELKSLAKGFYRNFGQNLIEILLLPVIDKKYLDKYINIEGLDFVKEAFGRGKGVIFAGIHSGSWELSNLICATLGFKFYLVVREQRYPRLNNLLNVYRRQKGCCLIQTQDQTRALIQALKNNDSIGITVDQGGKSGELVDFFGKEASMATGALRLALKYQAVILPAYHTRIKGPYMKVVVEKPFEVKKSGDVKEDIRNNLQELVRIFEKLVLRFPRDYLWIYKIWKYGKRKNILILDDGKTGHLRQSQAVSEGLIRVCRQQDMKPAVDVVQVRFKNKLSRLTMDVSSVLSGKYQCQGCLWCLKTFLEPGVYESLTRLNPDIIISCGSSLAAVNYALSRQGLSKSVVVMRPPLLTAKKFDLVIVPRHDRTRQGKNVVVTDGALNLINEDYLNAQARALKPRADISKALILGLLVGGNTRYFSLHKVLMQEVLGQVKAVIEEYDAQVLTSTSRRTPPEIESLLELELKDYPYSRLLIIASRDNPAYAVGGILALSEIVVVSPESISMISEAASSGKYVVVFKSRLDKRHERFLKRLEDKKYIYLCEPREIGRVITKILREQPEKNILKDSVKIEEALKRLI